MLANILVVASIYALVAIGYIIVYRSSRVLNFAHGEIFMIGGYMTFAFVASVGIDPLAALPFAIALGFTIGVAVYFVLLAPMAGHSLFAAVLVTIGFGIVIRGVALILFQGQILYPGRMLGFRDQAVAVLPGLEFTTTEIYFIASAVTAIVGLLVFFRYSSLGVRMRAASHDPRLAAYRGINIHQVFALAWGIAAAIAIFASALYSFGHQVNPHLTEVAIRGLAVALVGGMDSLKGVGPAALLVATAEQLTQHYVSPQASDAIPFIVLLLVLMARPWGLFGTKEAIDRI